ncbi:NAD(P)H-hydrate dehydratase [Parasphingorhabdus halotolerans]|uniref:Bifunctional NAD(P)H-hydrate repair enzyme n=1 Tax=Parasphingorhabdus halotolerans TaxID=2725558 RepID=A0A6H2DJJ4_9SPHN|nr:NAD(P)H-hydrate dehydratase [Parasphingorhabdus halotolerans]QJB68307.1 NAD(P)H-hydrate dehydratase [Parasphingorhabdus halotolerans]
MINAGYILTAAEMRHAEQELMDSGVTVDQLMKRAGEGAAQLIWRISANSRTTVLCGPGNNGGDGYVIAQWLLEKGVDVTVAACSDPKTAAAKNAKSLWKGETMAIENAVQSPQVIDCVFGTGLTRAVSKELYGHIERLLSGAQNRIAVDLPSGVDTDTGHLLNPVSQYDFTIALGASKPAHFLEPARSVVGEIVGVDIGISKPSQFRVFLHRSLKVPGADDHKYSRGLVVIIAGKMHGAAQLAALAAQQSGAGYVKIFAPAGFLSPNHSIVVQTYSSPEELGQLLSDDRISMVVVGPGLGLGDQQSGVLKTAMASEKALLLDADALTLLGNDFVERVSNRDAPTIATPHQGEFARISGEFDDSKLTSARDLSRRSGATIALKGPDTVIAQPSGHTEINNEACHWLSTAGTGDVLSGIIASRYAVEKNCAKAASQGQWLHTRAAQLSGASFSPEQLIGNISKAMQESIS